MKIFLALLLLTGVAVAKVGTDLENMICNIATGWGEGFVSSKCAASMNATCTSIFDIIPELIEFFTTFNFTKLYSLVLDIYTIIKESINQWSVCEHWNHIIKFFPHFWNFISNISTNYWKIMSDVVCVSKTWSSSDYYSCGICLGNIG